MRTQNCPVFSGFAYHPGMTGHTQADLFSELPHDPGTVVINDRCLLRNDGVHVVVLVAGLPILSYTVGDRMAEAHAMVTLVEQEYADQNEVARAFRCSDRTVRRHQRRFDEQGLAALGRSRGYPKDRPRLKAARARQVSRLWAEGTPKREIARRMGVTEKAVRKVLRRLGCKDPAPAQMDLPIKVECADPKLSGFSQPPRELPSVEPAAGADPKLSAFCDDEESSLSLDNDPADRSMDRMLAYLGIIDDAVPMFRNVKGLPKAGVLLAIPALVSSGVFGIAKTVYGSIGPAFYGLRTSLVIMLLMALLRIKRPEALKEHAPPELGAIVGLDRVLEVKSLRRKLARLAALGGASQLGHALAEARVAVHGERMGFLYIDGHVRVYHGKYTIPKAHVARMRLPMPATTDYWLNDSVGDPLFVVTAEANAGLCKMLPDMLAEVRSLVGQRRLTVVFDRGGWSPALFEKLITGGFDILTYRKGRSRKVPRTLFVVYELVIDPTGTAVDRGRSFKYKLADTGIRLSNGLRLRQVTWLSEDGSHQTPIVTSRRDLTPAEVAYRMFERWRQENFFKYLREEYALDALAEHVAEPDNPARDVPNPHWHRLDAEIKRARSNLAALYAAYGIEAAANPEHLRPTIRGFKIAHGKIGREIREAAKKVTTLRARRDRAPRRVPVADVVGGEVVKLAPEKKLLTNIFKMVAYQAESDLCRMVVPHYRRAEDEGRTLIQTALASSADIEVTDTELRVTIAPQSSAHRTKAIAALCEELNLANTVFPGTKLRLRYTVKGKQ
ncbi:MAG: helix-turn-helix domain-containing protein [Deltaproteobacteria bacterium]|nr:helix-turn-helix domain-containing protein [Deltaproteobacteria bacterium]